MQNLQDKNQIATPESKAKVDQIVELSNREDFHLKTALDLEKKIIAIQRSSRVSFPPLTRTHDFLRMHFRWYYNWHVLWMAEFLHYIILIIFLGVCAVWIYKTLLII